jgi:hypothetical protein
MPCEHVFACSSVGHTYTCRVAKRSTRRAREQERTSRPAPPPAPAPPPTFKSRQFWLGVAAAACLLIPVAIVAAVLASGDDVQTPGRAAATVTPSASEQAEALAEASIVRDKGQVSELTALMRQYAEDLDPVVGGINKTLPPESKTKVGPLAGAREAEEWVDASKKAAAVFDETVSGETATNVARGAFATAVRGIAATAETYRLAIQEPALRRELLARARTQRDDAMKAWETAGVQVDVINIAAGYGHQHPPRPGGLGSPPDDLPEGTDATDGG